MARFKKADKSDKNEEILNVDNIKKDTKSFIESILGDVSKTSATKQLIVGASSGWLTGFLAMKVGKAAACAVGGGIILLEVANQKGYIKINWDKVNKQIDKVSDRVEKKVTGEGPNWTDKMERFVDRKMDKAEGLLKNSEKKVKSWYSSIVGDSNGKLGEMHIFVLSFAAGVAIGVATS